LFPLHFQPEYSTLVLAPYSVNQLAVVRNVAISLPITHRLYVREHPAGLGMQPLSFYKELKKIPNVRLISPLASMHDLILGSDGVVTITGTAGWEALMLGKPVLTLGNVFYNVFGGVRKVKEPEKLAPAMGELQSGAAGSEDPTTLAASVLAATHEGLVENAFLNRAVLEPANVGRIAAAMIHHLQSAGAGTRTHE
jgi:hypothetical protein